MPQAGGKGAWLGLPGRGWDVNWAKRREVLRARERMVADTANSSAALYDALRESRRPQRRAFGTAVCGRCHPATTVAQQVGDDGDPDSYLGKAPTVSWAHRFMGGGGSRFDVIRW